MATQKKTVIRMSDVNSVSTGILTRLFYQILIATGAGYPDHNSKEPNAFVLTNLWADKMEKFISDSRNSIPQNTKDICSARGNLQKELFSSKGMSWKVFCKALRFLGAIRFELILKVKFENDNKEYVFNDTLNLGKREPYAKEFGIGTISLKDILQSRDKENE